jgi:hypothetical protein
MTGCQQKRQPHENSQSQYFKITCHSHRITFYIAWLLFQIDIVIHFFGPMERIDPSSLHPLIKHSTPGVPKDVRMRSHGGGGVVVGGGQMISHGGGQLPQVDAEEDGAVFVLAGGEEGEHLIHEMRRPPVAERRHVEQCADRLPFCFAIAFGQPGLQLLVCVQGVRLHGVDQVPDGHHHVRGQLHQDVVVLHVGDGDVGAAEGGLCLVEPCLRVGRPELG